MRNDLTELVFILDRSGSMYRLEKDTIGGFNSVLERNKALPGDANVTTVLFSHRCTLLHDRQPIRSVAPMTDRDYHPHGSTALLDAVGMAIRKIDNVQAHTAEAYRAGKVQFVIITDGLENASREYSAARVKQMIHDRQEQQGWDFLFLGANMDAIGTAAEMGIAADRAVTAMADRQGVSLQYEAVARATTSFRQCNSRSADWKEQVEKDTNSRRNHPH
ncbi:MAG: hypothetical protein ACI4MJ_05440 [Aristaeellaceae bacterium]